MGTVMRNKWVADDSEWEKIYKWDAFCLKLHFVCKDCIVTVILDPLTQHLSYGEQFKVWILMVFPPIYCVFDWSS